jgi:hypothetical protein
MNYRDVLLKDNLTISTASTSTYDLNLIDPISQLYFKFNIANHATTPVLIAHPARAVSKIEIIDGSNVIHSLSGEQMLAAMYYDRKLVPQSYLNGVTATQSYFTCGIDFGRWLWDPELALHPRHFDNLQMKVTYNKALYESSSTAMYMSIGAKVFDEKIVDPVGYLRRREVTTWTPAGTGTNYIKVPVDLPLRKIFLQGYSTTKNIRGQIHSFKLDENEGKKTPFENNTRTFLADQWAKYPPIYEPVIVRGSEVVYTMPSYEVQYTGISTAAEDISATTIVADTVTVAAATGTARVNGHAHGYIPFFTFPLEFGDQNLIDDWYYLDKIDSLQAELTASTPGTSPVGRLYTEQLKRYIA